MLPKETDDWLSLNVKDCDAWSFVGGPWRHADGLISPVVGPLKGGAEAYDGQRCVNTDEYLAFYTQRAYGDFEAEFRFRWEGGGGHGGAGMIFRAQDAKHYYLAHLPGCGQCIRASHFWACISLVDESGWVKILKMEMLHGVATELTLWRTARLRVCGNRFDFSVDGRPMSPVFDDTYSQPGRVGLEAWGLGEGTSSFEDVRIRGNEVSAGDWDESILPAKPWFVPYPVCDAPPGPDNYRAQQQSIKGGIIRTAEGNLLMAVGIQAEQYLVSSTDQGRTWSPFETVGIPQGRNMLFARPDGSLLTLCWRGKGDMLRSESADGGRTWSTPEPVQFGEFTPPENEPGLEVNGPSGLTQLADGTLLGFMAGALASGQGHDLWEWGTHSFGAYSIRSIDAGRTWSAPIPLNGPPAIGNKYDLVEFGSTVQTLDGKVLCLARPVCSAWMWEVWSDDSGESWSPATCGPFPCYAATALTTSSGVILVSGRMPGLGLYASHDHGMTWRAYRIDVALWAMGKMIEVEPDLVLYVYMDTYESYLRAQYLRVTSDGVEPALDMLPHAGD